MDPPLDTGTTPLHTSTFGAEAPRWLLPVLIPEEAVDSKKLCRWSSRRQALHMGA